jgi:simple sugar transport system permease protein
MRFWNIGGEGQFTIGAICAAIAAFQLGDTLPQPVMILVIALCGILGGGVYGVIAALLKVRFGTNETLLTLMLNYIALYLLSFLGETKADWNFFLSDDSVRPVFARFPDAANMITISIGSFNLNLSLVVALALCVLIYVYLKYTKHGYELAVVGDSPNTARYAGMKVDRIIVRTIFLSAALIGLAGAFYVSSAGTLSTSVTNDVGWTGIVVAWLAKLNTVGILLTSLLITVLQYGCQAASTSYPTIDANFADLLQGIILFVVLAADFFIRFKIVPRSKEVSK